MASLTSFEKVALSINTLTKSELKKHLRNFKKGNFRLDFTEIYLDSLSVEKLRHILLAAMITKRRA